MDVDVNIKLFIDYHGFKVEWPL